MGKIFGLGDIDAYDLPDELSMYQSQDMGKIGFVQDLIRGIKKVLQKETPRSSITAVKSTAEAFRTEPLLKRAFMMLEDEEWKKANELGYGKYFIDEVMGGATDDHLFINEIAGIKTIDIIPCDPEGEYSFDPTWHTIKDDMDNIDRNTLKAVGQTVMGVIYNEK